MTKTLRRALRYMRPYWHFQAAALFCAVILTASNFVWPWVTKLLVDDFFMAKAGHREHQRAVLYLATLLGLASPLVSGVFGVARTYLFARVGERAAADLRRDLFRHLHLLPMRFFDARRTGGIMSIVQSDVEALQVLYSNIFVDIITNLLMAGAALGFLLYFNTRLCLIALPIPILFGVALALFGRPLERIGRRVREDTGLVQEVLQESISGVREVKAFVRSPREVARFMARVMVLVQSRIRQSVLGATNWSVANVVAWGGMSVMILLSGLTYLYHPEEMSAGTMILFVNVLAMLFGPASAFTGLYNQTVGALGAADRVFEFVDTPPEVQAEGAPALREVQGRVQFAGVSFRYEEEGPEVLHGIELEVAPGEMIALVGPSGSGKTTLVSLLPRLYDATQGRVLIDGADVREVTLDSLRGCIAIVPQEPFLFGTTVRENIAFGREGATEDEIVAAAQAANAHDFILALPEGYETQVGERGARLSVGQKQRLAIARAVLRDPRVLILDEATSAQDSESEQLVQDAMRRLMAGRTSFVIAHRLSTVLRADRIVVLESGRVTETGTHAELLATDGTYARLHALQFRGILEVEDGAEA